MNVSRNKVSIWISCVFFSFRNDEAIDDNDVPNKDDEKDIAVPSKGPSKRQLKREKAIRIATRNRETNKLNIMRKALSYVSMVSSLNPRTYLFPGKRSFSRSSLRFFFSFFIIFLFFFFFCFFTVEAFQERMEIRETQANLADG